MTESTEGPGSDAAARPSTPARTSGSTRAGSSRAARSLSSYAPRSSEPSVAYPTRLPQSVYDGLMAAKDAVATSGNNLVVEALTHYLSSPEFRAKLDTARTRQEEAIRKLSGG